MTRKFYKKLLEEYEPQFNLSNDGKVAAIDYGQRNRYKFMLLVHHSAVKQHWEEEPEQAEFRLFESLDEVINFCAEDHRYRGWRPGTPLQNSELGNRRLWNFWDLDLPLPKPDDPRLHMYHQDPLPGTAKQAVA